MFAADAETSQVDAVGGHRTLGRALQTGLRLRFFGLHRSLQTSRGSVFEIDRQPWVGVTARAPRMQLHAPAATRYVSQAHVDSAFCAQSRMQPIPWDEAAITQPEHASRRLPQRRAPEREAVTVDADLNRIELGFGIGTVRAE